MHVLHDAMHVGSVARFVMCSINMVGLYTYYSAMSWNGVSADNLCLQDINVFNALITCAETDQKSVSD